MFQPLPPDLEAALSAARPRLGSFANVHYKESVESTNDLALAQAAAACAEGTSVVADVQTVGRGRRGHTWFSPAGAGLYLSLVVRPQAEAGDVPLVTLAAGAATAQAIQRVTGLPVELKWPNDVVIGRPWRKLGGILCETSMRGPRIDAVVVGIGLNLAPAGVPRELAGKATSLETELGRPLERAALLVDVLVAMRAVMEVVHARDRAGVLRAWRAFGAPGLSRAAVRWQDQGGERRGVACDVDSDGALLVETDGRRERVIAGEVTWETWSRE